MNKVALIVFFISSISYKGFSQIFPGQVEISKLPAPSWHYQEEYVLDTVVNVSAWNAQKAACMFRSVQQTDCISAGKCPR